MKKQGFCFTWNNYREVDIKYLRKIKCRYLVFGREIAPTTGTPHLQGYIYFHSERSFDEVRKILAPAHVDIQVGTCSEASNYCKKGEQEKSEYKTLGIKGPNFGKNADFEEYGKLPDDEKNVNKIEQIKEGIINGDFKNFSEIMKNYPNEFLRYNKALREFYETLRPKPNLQIKENLRLFQKKILSYIDREVPHQRSIIWIVDTLGGAGKSSLAAHLIQSHHFLTFNNGKTADIAYAWNGENVIFDLARSQQEHINYEIIEQVKNGVVFSSKYNSMMKVFERPHVFVFANVEPDYSKMSNDRWQVFRIKEDFDVKPIRPATSTLLDLSNDNV